MAAAVVINDIGSCLEKSHDSKNSDAYGVYLLPPLSAAYSSSSSLRAPPSLVLLLVKRENRHISFIVNYINIWIEYENQEYFILFVGHRVV